MILQEYSLEKIYLIVKLHMYIYTEYKSDIYVKQQAEKV